MRESVLNWYEFRKDAALLEVGAGEGELTGLFCRRCRSVTAVAAEEAQAARLEKKYRDVPNLQILTALTDLPAASFDYIVCLHVPEREEDPAAFLGDLMLLLRPEGILLTGGDNRYGLRYFCGYRENYTGIPFYGVNGYEEKPQEYERVLGEHGAGGRLYGRKEWEEILRKAQAKEYRFYYPVPDSRMPQFIFTDDYQNGINAAERLIDYDYADPAMTGLEHRMFRDVIDGGALPFLANSFLIEVTNGSTLQDIVYAVVTTDRGTKRAMATTVRRSGSVYKRPLYEEGIPAVRELHALTEELQKKNIPVVQTAVGQDGSGTFLEMPFVQGEGMTAVLDRYAAEDPERFLRVFDRIYEYTVRSFAEKENGEGRIFLDLAPCNCFRQEESAAGEDRLLFYDQEFVTEEGSPAFAMFRTLKYYFASSRPAREHFVLQEMYARYAITEEMIPAFEKKESAFIRSLRHTEKYQWLYDEATPDYGRIAGNMKKMIPEEKKPYAVGYVPGVFDLFHTGHLRLIERCKERCGYLIVGVLTDELVTYYKGQPPVISCADRMNVIRGLRAVDEVIPVDFSNTDKLDAWEQLHYDCHFSGDDHVGHWNDVLEELRKRGSNMEFFSYTEGISSTSIKEKMK